MPQINKFTPGVSPKISVFSTITSYGKRKSGKTVFTKWFVQAYKHMIPWAWIFTRTKFNASYESWVPKKFIIPAFTADALSRVMDRQEKAIDLALGDDPSFNPRAWVNWDDYNGKDVRYNEVLEAYYYTGRHYWTLNTFNAQHVTLTPPSIRSNTDLVVLFNTDYADSLEHYWHDFAGKMDRVQFYEMFRRCTEEENHFLAIDNAPNTPYDQKFFTGKADMCDESIEHIFGCADFWRDNLKQLNDIRMGKYEEKAQKIHDAAKWHDPRESKNREKHLTTVQLPSAWQPVKFPVPCPDEAALKGHEHKGAGYGEADKT